MTYNLCHFDKIWIVRVTMTLTLLEVRWRRCGAALPISEYTLMWPSKELVEMTPGFLGHHWTSKVHW